MLVLIALIALIYRREFLTAAPRCDRPAAGARTSCARLEINRRLGGHDRLFLRRLAGV